MNDPLTLGPYRRLCPRADTSLKKDRALPKSQGTSAKYGIFTPILSLPLPYTRNILLQSCAFELPLPLQIKCRRRISDDPQVQKAP